MTRAEIRELTPEHLDATAALLAARHRAHRRAEPALDARHEHEAVARSEIEAALAVPGASGVVTIHGTTVGGYLIGGPKDVKVWGGNVWIEAAGCAALDADAVRAMYAAIAGRWVDAGWTNHHVVVPATDVALVEPWFSLDFGQQHVYAIREAPPAGGLLPRSELIVRRPTRADLPALAELELVLPRHQAGSPVFSRLPIPSLAEATEELEADFDDPAYTTFVAEHKGRVVGSATGCSLEASSTYEGPNRPSDTALLGFAAVLPEARGLGAGRLLGEAVLAWARDAGYPRVMTDWRSTNIEADRTWRGLGFRPVFRRLHRLIG